MHIDFHNEESEYLLKAIEMRLKDIASTYQPDYQSDLEFSALRRMAEQLGVVYEMTQVGATHIISSIDKRQ